jgi:hypothetical protein
MALQIHPIMQDTADLDDLRIADAIEQKVPAGSTTSRDMERADSRHDVMPNARTGDIRAIREFSHRQEQRLSINMGLTRPKIGGCPLQDICEVELRDGAETNTPRIPHGQQLRSDVRLAGAERGNPPRSPLFAPNQLFG